MRKFLLKCVLNLPKSVLTIGFYNGQHLTFRPHMRISSLGGREIFNNPNAPCTPQFVQHQDDQDADDVKKTFKKSTRTSNNYRIIKVCSTEKKRIGSLHICEGEHENESNCFVSRESRFWEWKMICLPKAFFIFR